MTQPFRHNLPGPNEINSGNFILEKKRGIMPKLKENGSWQDLQKFINQSNQRFALLWLAIEMCLIASGIAIVVAILK